MNCSTFLLGHREYVVCILNMNIIIHKVDLSINHRLRVLLLLIWGSEFLHKHCLAAQRTSDQIYKCICNVFWCVKTCSPELFETETIHIHEYSHRNIACMSCLQDSNEYYTFSHIYIRLNACIIPAFSVYEFHRIHK